MTTAPTTTQQSSPLALALVNHPRATLQELAKAIGISKATLYRFCPTRDLLIKRLLEQSLRTLDDALDEARIEEGPVLEALKRLNAKHLEHREFTLFLTYYWNEVEKPMEENAIWEPKVDAFSCAANRKACSASISVPQR
jgi:TetR/AcrR family transcriptional repressor of mexCD-oprJ operon